MHWFSLCLTVWQRDPVFFASSRRTTTISESSREPESAAEGAELNSALRYTIANDYRLCHLFPSHSFS